MSKRFAIIFFISLTTIILLFVFMVVFLFIAPGISIFGFKYIGRNMHPFGTGEVDLYELFSANFTGIVLNTDEVPIEVRFSQEWQFKLEYYENYEGLTTSKISDPTISYDYQDGNLIINTSEFHKFIYESSTSTRYLKLYIPVVQATEHNAYNLVINSNRSNITFINENSEESRTPTLATLSLKTSGKVNYGARVDAETFILESASTITVDPANENSVHAKNYVLKSTVGKIDILSDVEGDLNLETKNGSISLISCNNLTVKTGYGNVGSAGADGVVVRGVANITTTAGNVVIKEVLSESGESSITTSSGNIKINKIFNGSASTKRGRVEIVSVNAFKIESDVGKVFVEESLGSIDVSTKRGDIHLGGNQMILRNPKAFSRLGKVFVTSASGDVNIETIYSNVEFKNGGSENIFISAGGRLSADGLCGKVKIFAEDNSTLIFDKISDTSELEFGAKCKVIEIRALNNTKEDVSYKISGSPVLIREFKNNDFILFDGLDGNNRTDYSYNNSTTTAFLSVKSKNNQARVDIYFKAPN